MLISERGDLGEMGDHEDLVGRRKVGERRADRVGDVATDTGIDLVENEGWWASTCLLYTSPSPRDRYISRMPSSA